MSKILIFNKIDNFFRSWRVADASVVGRKNTNNGTLRLLQKMKTNKGTKFIIFFFLSLSYISEARPYRYRIYGIDSIYFQYKIKLIRVSDQSLYTIYSSKISNERINKLIKEKYVKIKLGGCYKLRFYERIHPIAEASIDQGGNSIYYFDIDRLEGLYYDNRRRSIFKKYQWKTPKNKRIAQKIKSCEAIE